MITFFTERWRRWRYGPLHVWYHPSYRLPLAQAIGGPMSPRRADDALTWAMSARAIRPEHIHEPRESSWEDIGLVHTSSYLDALDEPKTVAHILGTEEARVPVREILETWRRATGGTTEAARHVLTRGGRALNLLGGFHHAEPDKGGGFCALNDVAIAVAAARRDGMRGQIGIIDLDAHPPDGIVACLQGDPLVSIVSVAAISHWHLPPRGALHVLDERIPPGSTDKPYLDAVDRALDALPRCDLVFYLAGADPLALDPLGGLSVSEAGLRERDRRVMARLARTPTVILPAGGYRDRSWRALAGTIAEAAHSDRVVPEDFDPLMRRTRRIMATLDPKILGETELITEEELFGSLGASPTRGDSRFLGYYTRHGLEHALTAYGYLSTIARLGFTALELSIEVTGRGPDRMLISAMLPQGREILVDLAASIRPLETKGAPPVRTLFIEWLELKDPRVPFSQHKPKLPGQQRPGLGLADETMQLLGRAAERLKLGGVSFIPSHYHVAWMAKKRFVAVDPVERGKMRAIVRALKGIPLDRASVLLEGPGLSTEDGESVRWQPVEMVIPLDEGLTRFIEEGELVAKQAEEAFRDRLIAPIPERHPKG